MPPGSARFLRGAGPSGRRLAGRAALAAAALGALLCACAQIGPPGGGPEDKTAPRVAGTFPDSGQVKVPLTDSLLLIFSEPMNRHTVEDAFVLSPPVEYRERHWKGQSWSLRLAAPLKPGLTYAGLLGTAAKDRHGLALAGPWAFAFSTGDSLDTGRIAGKVVGQRYDVRGAFVYVWPWDAGAPDTTGHGYPRDPLRLGQADGQGNYAVHFLPRGRPLRICAFYDQDKDREFDPGIDAWGCLDAPLVLADTSKVVSGVDLYVAYPDEPGTVAGSVVDSLCLRSKAGKRLTAARATRDSLRGWLDEYGPEHPSSTLLEGQPSTPKVTAQDSLRIGRQLLDLDSLFVSAGAESSACAAKIVVRLGDTDSSAIREAKTQGDFRWNDVPPGVYKLWAFRDLDGDGRLGPKEPLVRYPYALEVAALHTLEKLNLELPAPGKRSP